MLSPLRISTMWRTPSYARRPVMPSLPAQHPRPPLSIVAARDIVSGQTLVDSGTPLLLEFVVGLAYVGAGIVLLRLFEFESRRSASLETM